MDKRRYPHKLLLYQALGFLAILAIAVVDELLGLPERHLFPYASHPEWGEFAVESGAIVAIAATIMLMTRRLVKRLFYLEGFLRVCAWCRKIHHEGRWVSMEEYFSSGLDTKTTHGMCPECFKKGAYEQP